MLLVGLVGFEPTTSLLKGDNPFTSGSLLQNLLQNLVVPAGLEPATPSFVAKYSNPLSYGTVKLFFLVGLDGVEPSTSVLSGLRSTN